MATCEAARRLDAERGEVAALGDVVDLAREGQALAERALA